MEEIISKFKHRYPFRVRTFHVDRQNVVHNVWYLYFFEEARVEYVREVGLLIDEQTFITHDKFFVVKNSCEYFAPVFYDEELTLMTRTMYVKKSSIGFEHLAVRRDGSIAARAEHVLVSVDENTNLPRRVPDDLRKLIVKYEGGNVAFVE
jgi:acyl-CoA thioester hydrolase